MKNKTKALKIAALIIAVALIGMILFITNAFVGNPISSALADKGIKEYVAQNYLDLDLEVEKARYNFKFNEYMARAKSKSSVDTHFAIYYRGGKVKRDDYETYVLGKYNTLSRLEQECSQLIIPILSKIPGLENNRAMVQIDKWEYEKVSDDIKLDMKYEKTLPIDMKVNIRADLSDVSLKSMAEILEDSHQILRNNGYHFTSYDIFSEYDGEIVMINDVTPADIESGELEKLLNDAKNYVDPELDKVIGKGDKKPEPIKRISVFIKDGSEKTR